jgi:hypothetical protein
LTGLRRWVEPISESQPAVEIDRAMRAAFVTHVEEVSSWVPLAWAPAVLWVRVVPSLPLGEDEPGPFRGRWPFTTPSERRSLDDLLAELEQHRAAMGGSDAADGWALRAELDARVTRLFRLHAGGPAAPFCHLTLVALDLERLRGALLRRALFPDLRSEASWA